jgi:hypothetical protein
MNEHGTDITVLAWMMLPLLGTAMVLYGLVRIWRFKNETELRTLRERDEELEYTASLNKE